MPSAVHGGPVRPGVGVAVAGLAMRGSFAVGLGSGTGGVEAPTARRPGAAVLRTRVGLGTQVAAQRQNRRRWQR